MFWSKKDNKEGLPDLPPSPFLNDDILEHKRELDSDLQSGEHALPSFPDSPINKGFSQAAIKDAIKSKKFEEEKEDSEVPEFSKKFQTIEVESTDETDIPESPIPSPPKTFTEPQRPVISQKQIYVKIDKFRSARTSLEEIKIQVEQIADLLNRIREIKLREEQELSAWEKEVESVKSRLQNLNENIFEKIE